MVAVHVGPLGVIRPIAGALTLLSVNQRLPSVPTATAVGTLPAGRRYSVIVPLVVIRPMAGMAPTSVNQRLPSAPTLIWRGTLPGLPPFRAMLNSVIVPLVVIRPIALVPWSVNQRLPSGPAAILNGELVELR